MHIIRPLRYTIATCGLFMLVGGLFAGFRLAPLSMRGGVSWGTLWPLVAAALTTVFEAALIFGTPVSFVLARGRETTASQTQSASSSVALSERKTFGWAAAGWFVVASAIGAYANVRLGAPGRVAHGVVQGARAVCEDGEQHRVEPVPLIGARWVCAPSAVPRIVGEVVRSGATARYSARDLRVSDDLDHVDLTELDVLSAATRSRPSIHVAVQGARLRGAWPWAKPRRVSGVARAVLVAGLAALLAWIAGELAIWHARWRRRKGLVVAIVGSVCAWYALAAADAHAAWPLACYAVIPVLSALGMVSVHWLLSNDWSRGLAAARAERPTRESPVRESREP